MLAAALVGIMVTVTSASGVQAQNRSIATIRDTEIERILRGYASPLLLAAGLDPQAVRIIVVNDRALNAFVAGGQNVFINTGLLIRAQSPGQVVGVMAHEIGHIAGGHLARLNEALDQARLVSLLTSVLGIAAVVVASGQQSRSDVPTQRALPGAGGGRGTGDIGLNQLLSFTRAQENQADQAALAFLDTAGISSRGLLEFMEILGNQEFLAAGRQDPYVRTHPLSRDRVDALRNHTQRSRFVNALGPPEWVVQHRRMRAKLQAFIEPPQTTLLRVPATDTSVDARYARAIALFRGSDLNAALTVIDGLLREYPRDPYFHELRAQMLFENGRIADAIPPLRQALALLPDADLVRVDLAQALIELNDPRQLREAQTLLTESRRSESANSRMWRLTAIAYGRDGQPGLAAQALAEQAVLEGRFGDAIDQSQRAIRTLPEGSAGWLRAQDVSAVARTLREQTR